ncbi:MULTISPECIES: ATP-binding cassette domain-containing protein [Pontibacillus]|uniref:ATP-binding cassette domain-containing protein n=1 Tax=Pontibacillus chungwhensis TaxID=265426 RepID=A0ABY8V2M0_9BACI|nr:MULTISPECIES: ATP-binding cassette domain-containing protein [Pontibacillus]MCD5322442.1 ATP-binding cassette domain-containing protein [Pontibacillus sp. HN14]WIF99728.1 ATP-binding cassette domain-containing protein [Pontibacillus chungwhensis]
MDMVKGTIYVEHLSKTFKKGNVKAVKDVSFSVEEGEFFAFLGPNGAGKSTTVQIVTTLISPSAGKVYVAEQDVLTNPKGVREHIGVALQETGIDPSLTGREMLELQCRIFGFTKQESKSRTDELLEVVQLVEAADRICGNYSGGMRRRLDLALTLVNKPKILFLDEPTTGLDPSNRKSIWDYLERLNKEEGTTIFLTTQYLEEADTLADRISIIDDGEIVATGTPQELKAQIGNDIIAMTFAGDNEANEAEKAIKHHMPDADLVRRAAELNMYVQDGTKRLMEVVRVLDQEEITVQSINVNSPTLDDIFLKITAEGEKKRGEVEHG